MMMGSEGERDRIGQDDIPGGVEKCRLQLCFVVPSILRGNLSLAGRQAKHSKKTFEFVRVLHALQKGLWPDASGSGNPEVKCSEGSS